LIILRQLGKHGELVGGQFSRLLHSTRCDSDSITCCGHVSRLAVNVVIKTSYSEILICSHSVNTTALFSNNLHGNTTWRCFPHILYSLFCRIISSILFHHIVHFCVSLVGASCKSLCFVIVILGT